MPNRKDIPAAGDPAKPDCTECKGMGVVRVRGSESRGNSSLRTKRCPECKGTGKQK